MKAKGLSESALFLRGVDRYLDAMTAISAFQDEVQKMCTEIYEHHASELAAQMGLDDADCEPFAQDEPEERWAEVGVSRPTQPSLYVWSVSIVG
jgi:hypothetical protein